MRRGNLIGPIIVAIGVIIAAIAFAVVTMLLQTADSGTELRLTRAETALADESEARQKLEGEVSQLKADLGHLRDDMSLIANRAPPPDTAAGAAPAATDPQASTTLSEIPDEDFEHQPTEGLTEEMKLAKTRFNKGITQPRNKTMLELLGQPRDSYNDSCQSITNEHLKSLLETRQVGPIQATMLKPALDSLGRVFTRLKDSDPDIFAKLGTAGSLCVRFIRGSTSAISNHSWGTAIDLTLEGKLDAFANGGTQAGLLILAEYFNDEGWFWGAAYQREDSMHFEVGEETLTAWKAAGLL